MLNARNVIAITIVLAVISLAWGFYTLTRPPDSGGLGSDSYGTRVHGLKGLFEILDDLKIPTERSLGPPTSAIGRQVTVVLWNPQPDLVQVEPAYLRALANWVKDGGRVVVATDGARPTPRPTGFTKRPKPAKEATVLGELGLPDVSVSTIDLRSAGNGQKPAPAGRNPGVRRPEPPPDRSLWNDDDTRRLREMLTGTAQPIPTRAVTINANGVWSPLRQQVSTIQVPEATLQVLDVGASKPDGTITFRDPAGTDRTLAALYRRGKGELVVLSPPAIVENHLIARHDNSVLAVRLLAAPDRPVVFDEFYHGLTIRGNPLWLFAQRGYAATTLCLLAAIGLWMWRQSVFLGPPLAPQVQSRRSLGEYVDAMARFLNRGGSSQAFLLREVRAGVLRSIRDELHLPPSRDHVEVLAAALARRDPGRARQLVETMTAVDAALSRKRVLKDSIVVDLFKRMSRCL